MMDSKQLAIIYLMEESNHMSLICSKNIHSHDKKKTYLEITDQLGKLMAACKEVVEELKLQEEEVMQSAETEITRRNTDR